MIKLLEFVRRMPSDAPEQFHSAWRKAHADFFAATPTARSLVTRCELNHRLLDDYSRARHAEEVPNPPWDGVRVFWLESLEHLGTLQTLPGFADAELGAGVVEKAQVVTNDATVIVDKPGGRERAGLKLLCILRRNAALERAAFHRHWREHHGGLFKRTPDLNAPLLAYDQNHGLDLADAPYDGVTEQWFASLPEWIESLNAPSYPELVDPDVKYLLDADSIRFMLAGQPAVIHGL
jgi:hypothetical protein